VRAPVAGVAYLAQCPDEKGKILEVGAECEDLLDRPIHHEREVQVSGPPACSRDLQGIGEWTVGRIPQERHSSEREKGPRR
jgi:hypothetical protein